MEQSGTFEDKQTQNSLQKRSINVRGIHKYLSNLNDFSITDKLA